MLTHSLLSGFALAQTHRGDPERGKQLSVECFACHGEHGNSPSPITPRIGGQHESYLLLALKAYLDGARADSLMRGAVLNKSDQDLRDIAAYFAAQTSDLVTREDEADRNSPAARSNARFDYGEKSAGFTSLLARARQQGDAAQYPADVRCPEAEDSPTPLGDHDGDGVPNRFDAAPRDSMAFALDQNDDGYLEICNIHQFAAIGRRPAESEGVPPALVRSYQLVRDLDGSELDGFQPIGSCGPSGNCMRALGQFGYRGTFVGHGHVIRNLTVSHPSTSGVGPFGVLAETGVIVDLHFQGGRVTGRAGTGGLVGSNFGVIAQSTVSGQVDAALAVGGLVGGSAGLVFDSEARGRVSGQQAVGGLVGDMTGAVYLSHVSGAVTGTRGVGGLVGLNTFGIVLGSSSDGQVQGQDDVGGLVGVNTDAKIRNSYSLSQVTGTGSNIGGLVGFNSLSSVGNSFARGAVAGQDGIGGLVGRNNGEIENAYASGAVQGPGLKGAVVGIVVGGVQRSTFAPLDSLAPYGATQVRLASLTGDSTGWAPTQSPVVDLLDYYCDRNHNGYVDPDESAASNYVWLFGGADEHPALRCARGPL